MVNTAATSRTRLLAAAAREFAARGYAGASVDRIARGARLNKAMIYYHFKSKAGLYRTIVRTVFEAVLDSATQAADAPLPPPEKVRRFIRAFAEIATWQPDFPPLWIREFSMGISHLDQATLVIAGRIVATLGRILAEGCEQGVFRPVNPLQVHIGIVAPILLFQVSAEARARLAKASVPGMGSLTLEDIIGHVTQSTLGSLCIHSEDTHA